jgi:hypothetical protein
MHRYIISYYLRARNILMGTPISKGEIIQSIVDLASKTGEFTAEKGKDTDLVS